MITAVYPGSFDPVTLGHLDIIRRGSAVFDRLVIGVLNNSEKKSPLFTLDERVIMLKEVTEDLPNVSVESFEGLLVDFVRAKNSNIIIRGLRAMADFNIESRSLFPVSISSPSPKSNLSLSPYHLHQPIHSLAESKSILSLPLLRQRIINSSFLLLSPCLHPNPA